MLNSQVQVAPFREHPIIDLNIAEPTEFDIIAFDQSQSPDFKIDNKFSLQQYCTCLLHRLFLLDKSDIKPFIQYQCEQITEPLIWLNKFEKLIDLNRDLYTTKDRIMKMEKALMSIEVIRQEMQSNKFNHSAHYNFPRLKQKLKEYPTTEEKLSCLYEAKTEYLQNKPQGLNPNEVPFDEKINLEIDLLKSQKKLSTKRQQTYADSKKQSPLSPPKKSPQTTQKFKINSNLNQFVDIFFQLIHEKKTNGKPYLEASPNELAEMIVAWFKDKENKDISIDTVKTILKPSRFEKRPKGSARFDIPD